MALFGKKKEEVKTEPTCACNGNTAVYEAEACCCGGNSAEKSNENSSCGEAVDGICCIKVLGAGCKSCLEQYENAKKAVEELGLSVEVDYITDMEKVMAYGVMSMPALVVNEQVVSMGKVLKAAEVIKLFGKLGF